MIRNRLLELNALNLQGSDLLHQMPHPVLLLDVSGQFVYANPAAEQFFNLAKQAKELRFEDVFQGDVAFSSRVKFLNATQEALVFLAKTVYQAETPPIKLKLSAHYAQQDQLFLLQVILNAQPDMDESFFRNVIENIPADIAVFDQNQNYIYVNPNAVRDPEIRSWLIGKNDLQYARMRKLPEQMAELRRARFGQLLESGVDQYSFEETTDVKGVRSNKLRLMKAVRNTDGSFRYAIGYGVSIDQLKAYESKIKNQEIAMEASTVGIAVLNEQGAYTYLNEAHVKMYGFNDQSELIGKTWKVFYSPEEAERIEQQIFPSLIKDGKWMGETSGIVRGVSTPIHTDLSLTRLPDGGMVCVCRDVTSRKKKDLANQRMAIVASKTTNLVIIGSASGRIEWVNDAFLRQTGFSM
ncbi:MAG: PAS domain-containing protein, partial [Bacteroidota bacterium]